MKQEAKARSIETVAEEYARKLLNDATGRVSGPIHRILEDLVIRAYCQGHVDGLQDGLDVMEGRVSVEP